MGIMLCSLFQTLEDDEEDIARTSAGKIMASNGASPSQSWSPRQRSRRADSAVSSPRYSHVFYPPFFCATLVHVHPDVMCGISAVPGV